MRDPLLNWICIGYLAPERDTVIRFKVWRIDYPGQAFVVLNLFTSESHSNGHSGLRMKATSAVSPVRSYPLPSEKQTLQKGIEVQIGEKAQTYDGGDEQVDNEKQRRRPFAQAGTRIAKRSC